MRYVRRIERRTEGISLQGSQPLDPDSHHLGHGNTVAGMLAKHKISLKDIHDRLHKFIHRDSGASDPGAHQDDGHPLSPENLHDFPEIPRVRSRMRERGHRFRIGRHGHRFLNPFDSHDYGHNGFAQLDSRTHQPGHITDPSHQTSNFLEYGLGSGSLDHDVLQGGDSYPEQISIFLSDDTKLPIYIASFSGGFMIVVLVVCVLIYLRSLFFKCAPSSEKEHLLEDLEVVDPDHEGIVKSCLAEQRSKNRNLTKIDDYVGKQLNPGSEVDEGPEAADHASDTSSEDGSEADSMISAKEAPDQRRSSFFEMLFSTVPPSPDNRIDEVVMDSSSNQDLERGSNPDELDKAFF